MSDTDKTQLITLIGKENVNKIEDLYEKITPEHEFEFMFFNYNKVMLNYEKYLIILDYMKKHLRKQTGNALIMTDNLDISHFDSKDTTHRITINGLDKINYYKKMLDKKRNHVIFNTLIALLDKNTSELSIMSKTKGRDNVIDIDDLNMRVRLSEEKNVKEKKIKELGKMEKEDIINISFRLKQRVSIYIHGSDSSDNFVRIDLTITNTTKDIKNIQTCVPNYELEVECGLKNKAEKKNILNIMFNTTLVLMKVIQQSNNIITKSVSESVLNYYRSVMALPEYAVSLSVRNPVSLEIQHLTEVLANRYTVTDKADGDRNILLIMNNNVYFITNNMIVRDSGITLNQQNSIYNGTVMDGELLFLKKKGRHMYLIFDCLYSGTSDIRKTARMMDRLKKADEIVNNCFILGGQQNHTFTEYSKKSGEFNLNTVLKFHETEIYKYMKAINNDILIEPSKPLIRRKYFIEVHGAQDNEIFAYADLIYKQYTENKDIKCPYFLDGLIFQPLEQEYIANLKDSKYIDYKWKPPTKNSIDFYIEYAKDDNNNILTVFDNSNDEFIRNKPYRICNLYVGQRTKIGVQPVLFKEQEGLYTAYLFLDKGEVRDIDGNIVEDKTVVEFYYNMDDSIDMKLRWVPIRTRNDKTDIMMRYKKNYGNYIDTANLVWRSIVNPVLIADFNELSKGGKSYETKMNSMRGKISHALIISATKENAYYQLKTNLAKPMRQFHNWIKSIVIYTFCHKEYENEVPQSILDIACGRGGDLLKFYYAKCAYYVGVDVDREGLVSAVDGAESRYRQMRETHPNFPEATFLQADCGGILDVPNQQRIFGSMNEDNINKINKYFPENVEKKVKFDRINCQFAVHYFLKNDETWKNFKINLNKHLKDGGIFICSTFDADRTVELFKTENVYTVNYTTQKGEKKILFEIKKNNEFGQKPYKTGNAIDLFASWMFKEGHYNTEYLVDYDFFVSELLKDCNLELIDSDFFDNQYEIHKEYFLNYAKYDDNPETRQFLLKVANYYEHNELNGACFKYTRLERYYVFRKKAISALNRKIKQKGGTNILSLLDSDSVSIYDKHDNNNQTYIYSLYHLFKSHNLIPDTLTLIDFISDFELNVPDSELSSDELYNLNKKIVLEHDNNKKQVTVIDGLNYILIEKNCNDEYEVFINKTSDNANSKTIVIMKANNKYSPLFHKRDNAYIGIFNNSDDFIEKIANFD